MQELTPEEKARKLKQAKEMMERKRKEVFGEVENDEDIVIEEDLLYDKNRYENAIKNGKIKHNKKFTKDRIGEKYYHRIKEIKGNVWLEDCQEQLSFTSLRVVGKSARFAGSKITELPELEEVAEFADFTHTKIKTIPKLKKVGGAYFKNSEIESLPELENVKNCVIFGNSSIKDVPKLAYVGQSMYVHDCYIKELPALKFVGDDLKIYNTPIKGLPALESAKSIVVEVGNIPFMPKLTKCDLICINSKVDYWSPVAESEKFTLKEFRKVEKELRECKTFFEVTAIRKRLDAEQTQTR